MFGDIKDHKQDLAIPASHYFYAQLGVKGNLNVHKKFTFESDRNIGMVTKM